VQSHTTETFRKLLAAAPSAIQSKADNAYRLWAQNPAHPSLRFKKVHNTQPIYAVRIDLDWRAVGTLTEAAMVWFWIGPHGEYEKLLSRF
jgi:hypothetical protein